jgi:uncharacterized protein YcbK (DUF882 family)
MKCAGGAIAVALLVAATARADAPPLPVARCLPARANSCVPRAKKDARAERRDPVRLAPVLTVVNLHTHEALAIDATTEGPNEAADLERLLRDRTNWETHTVASQCIATIRAACFALDSRRVEIVSGYRSDKLNEMLRKKGHHVARHSQHVLGNAVDFRLVGVPYRELYEFARRTHDGGVGAYPDSLFVHVDAGPRRRWNGE